MTEPERIPCPDCGKEVTWLADGSRPRQHKCEPKPVAAEQPEGGPMKITADLVIAKYVETRDLIAEKKKAFDAEVADLKALQEKREAWLKGKLDEMGVESFKSAHGTCYVAMKDSATVADWENFKEWVIINEEWDFLEHRVSKTAVKQRLDDGQVPPPGVNYTTIKQVQVRRS